MKLSIVKPDRMLDNNGDLSPEGFAHLNRMTRTEGLAELDRWTACGCTGPGAYYALSPEERQRRLSNPHWMFEEIQKKCPEIAAILRGMGCGPVGPR